MKRPFPVALRYLGYPILILAWALAARLVWEQTFLSWERGPQMVGFSLMHSSIGPLLVIGLLSGLLWVVGVLVAALVTRNLSDKIVVMQLLGYALAWCVLAVPYGLWQRLFINNFPPAQAAKFFTYAAATGDLRTVKAFLARGVEINVQTQNGTALHGAAVEGELDVIEFLLAQGADVNALNAYGDSPLANAAEARERATETQGLLAKHGGTLIRGSKEQRDRAISEQVRKDIEQMDKARSAR